MIADDRRHLFLLILAPMLRLCFADASPKNRRRIAEESPKNRRCFAEESPMNLRRIADASLIICDASHVFSL